MNEKTIATDKDVLLAEYREIAASIRFHSDVRWKLLSVVTVVAGGLLTLSLQLSALRLPLNIFGLLTSCVFVFVEYRTQLMWHVLFHRALEVESVLGIQGMFKNMQSRKRPWYWLDSTKAIRIAYFVLIAYWMLAILGVL